jgi:hypothetical protein
MPRRSKSGSSSSAAGRRGDRSSQVTTDHRKIQQWAEARGGKPSCVVGTGGGGDTGLLRIDFPGYSGKGSLQEIPWKEFFQKFDEQKLALLYQEQTTGGQRSSFNKLISGDKAGASGAGRKSGRSSASRGGSMGKSRSSGSKKSSGSARKSAASAAGGASRAKRKPGTSRGSKAKTSTTRAARSSSGRAGAGRRRGR